ncbi:MAG TPA: CPBP family intramembrane glutamic endopeptidase [Terriglobales bacterium]|nr:CPBP family intramembrane glutamic endopeptidase [Terriglobales bacterium]
MLLASSESSKAPAWHTALVLFLMLALSLLGARVHLPALVAAHGRAPIYLVVVFIEWTTVLLIWWEGARRGIRLRELVGGNWSQPVHFLRDLGLGVAFILLFGGVVLQGLAHLLKAAPPQAMRAMMPQTTLEVILWVLMSLTAGFCEEVIFRGYLQRQFSEFTHSVVAGIVLQAVVFGLGHGYQGWRLMSLIAFYGGCFGLLAFWRHSLRPGMLGHALQDTAGGLLARFLTR